MMLDQYESVSSLKTMSSTLPFTGTKKTSSAGLRESLPTLANAELVGIEDLLLAKGQPAEYARSVMARQRNPYTHLLTIFAADEIGSNANAFFAIVKVDDTVMLLELPNIKHPSNDNFTYQAVPAITASSLLDSVQVFVAESDLEDRVIEAVDSLIDQVEDVASSADITKTSSSGLAKLIKFNETSVDFIDNHAQSVLEAVNRFEALVDPASIAKENVNSAIADLRGLLDTLNREKGSLEIAAAEAPGGLSDSARKELDKLNRVVDGMIANLDTTINRTQDAVKAYTTYTTSPEQGAPDLAKTRPNILVESGGIIGNQIDIAEKVKTFSEDANQEISQLDFVNNTAACTMKGVNPANLTAADLNNAIAIAETEAGAKAFRAQGLEVFMLSDLEVEGVYDLLSLAMFAKGRFLRASGVENPALRALMEFAYKSLTNTNQAMPAEFFASTPLATVISISLQPVTRVYEEGELEAYHLMRLLAMIAA